jgi:hypothetical protein
MPGLASFKKPKIDSTKIRSAVACYRFVQLEATDEWQSVLGDGVINEW